VCRHHVTKAITTRPGTLPDRAVLDHARRAELEAFLVALAPREELIRRWALMSLYKPCMTDSTWRTRIRLLLDGLQLDEDGIAKALREANAVAAELTHDSIA
jgi:hypothetical protein